MFTQVYAAADWLSAPADQQHKYAKPAGMARGLWPIALNVAATGGPLGAEYAAHVLAKISEVVAAGDLPGWDEPVYPESKTTMREFLMTRNGNFVIPQ